MGHRHGRPGQPSKISASAQAVPAVTAARCRLFWSRVLLLEVLGSMRATKPRTRFRHSFSASWFWGSLFFGLGRGGPSLGNSGAPQRHLGSLRACQGRSRQDLQSGQLELRAAACVHSCRVGLASIRDQGIKGATCCRV